MEAGGGKKGRGLGLSNPRWRAEQTAILIEVERTVQDVRGSGAEKMKIDLDVAWELTSLATLALVERGESESVEMGSTALKRLS